MPLQSGTRLGPYEIVGPLGAGGMGEVYRARDTRLDRTVAIKVLPAHVATDAERGSRFEREARAVARLNHPNILALHDVGDADGVRFIVTELVDGEPVKGPLPVKKLLDVATQIAAGLAAAHDAGIVHRDLKPDNILVTRDGRPKILDFGLARDTALTGDGVGATALATSAGTVLGTVAYMSPEQARGALADSKSDQFSFGLVLYELASGQQAFSRASAAQTLAAIIEADPDLTPLALLPPPLRWVIERCLAKDPSERYDSTADLFRDLRHLRDRQSEVMQSGTLGIVAPQAKRRWHRAVVAGLALALAGAAVAWIWTRGNGASPIDAYRFVPFAVDAGVQAMPAWSADGQSLAFSGEVDGYYQIFIRRLDQSTPFQITSLAGDCLSAVWHPDGTKVYFQLAQTRGGFYDAHATEVWVVSAAGGAPERLLEGVPAYALAPDGKSMLLASQLPDGTGRTYMLKAYDLGTRSTRELTSLPGTWNSGYFPTTRGMKFAPDGSALAVIHAGTSEMSVLPNPLTTGGGAPRTVRFALPRGGFASLYEFDWMPDSRHVVMALRDASGGDQSLWMGDIDRGTVTRVTASAQWESTPAVSPDGARIAFSSTPLDWDITEIEIKTGASRPLVASARYDGWGDWLPDGSGLVFSTQRTGRFEIWIQAFRDGVARAVVTPDAFPDDASLFLVQGAVSPDGRSLAYVRYSQGATRIYVTALTGSKPVQLTTATSDSDREDGPRWSPDGRWILFRRGSRLMKTLASGGAEPIVIADNIPDTALQSEGTGRWLPSGDAVIYRDADGLRARRENDGSARLVSGERPILWNLSRDGRTIYAILKRARQSMDLVTIDVATGAVTTLRSLGRKPLTPDYAGYWNTVRALRLSPDGTRLMYAHLNPTSDIWILDRFGSRIP